MKQEAKRREDSIQAYQAGGRQDLADKEAAELAIIRQYLPAQLSEAEVMTALEPLVAAAKENNTDKNFGALMKQAMQQLNGQADGKVVSTVLKQLLAKQ